MTTLKRILLAMMAVMLLFTVACGSNGGTATPAAPAAAEADTPAESADAPAESPEAATADDSGTIMFLSSVSSGPSYDAMMCILEGMGGALGYDIKVVYGDMQNDPAGNLAAVKNGMTDDVKAIISMQDGGIQNILDEYPDLYVMGYTTAMNSVYGGASGEPAPAATDPHFLGSVSGDSVDAGATGVMYAEKVIENGYHKVSVLIFPPFAYPEMIDRDASFRATIDAYNETAADEDKIEVVGDAHILMFSPLEDTYFMESEHQDLDCIVAFCDPGFVYSPMISARDQGLISDSTKLMAVGYIDDPNFLADFGGEGTAQVTYGAAPESILYCMAMIDNAVHGLSYPDMGTIGLVDSPLYLIDSAEDMQNVVEKTVMGVPDFANCGVSVDEFENVLLRYNPDATYADLMELMTSDSMTLDRFN